MKTFFVTLFLLVVLNNLIAIDGICFSPYRAGQNPTYSVYPSQTQVMEDLVLIHSITDTIRTFGIEGTLSQIPEMCSQIDLNCWVGGWLGSESSDSTANFNTTSNLINIGLENYPTTVGIIVGNEILQFNTLSESRLIHWISRVRDALPNVQISYSDTWYAWTQHPNVAQYVDVVMINIYPYWEGLVIEDAAIYTIQKYNEIKTLFPNKQVMISEASWPSAGLAYELAIPSEANQALYLNELMPLLENSNARYCIFEAFDEAWKTMYEGEVGAHWGLYYQDRTPKPLLANLSVSENVSKKINVTAYPNPFNQEVNLKFYKSDNSWLTINVYNIKGQKIKTLLNDFKPSGEYRITWDGKDNNNKSVSSGVYFFNMKSGKFTSSRKIILMK